jgi:hypothetical protein
MYIHRAELAGLDRRGGRGESGDDHRHISKRLPELLEHFDVRDVGQSKAGNHEIDRALSGQLQPFLACTGQSHAEAGAPQRAADRVECGAVLVDDEDRWHVYLWVRGEARFYRTPRG